MQDIHTVEIRQLELSDYDELQKSMKSAYDWTPAWSREEIIRLITKFPEGQFVAVADGNVVGSALSIIVDYPKFGDEHTYLQITGNYAFDTHDPEGNVMYGIDVFIHPDYRGLRLGRRLYDSRKELCEHLNLESIMFGGRLPNYHEHADELTPRQYIDQVRHRAFFDPVLTFQLSNDFHVKKVLRGYMPDDHESQEFAALLQWNNIYYTKPSSHPDHHKSIVRLGLVQWQMRNYRSLEGLYEQFDFFVDAVSAYNADFALFPEFFSAPLMAEFNELKEAEAIRKLAGFTEEIRDQFASLAISYNVNIITGSMPFLDDTGLYNVGYFCGRDGRIEMYEKIHCTPDEVQSWGLQGGNKIKVIDTDCGKIGILICYDVEFPELPRILAEQGMQILFVPFLTDTQNGYARVRNCARSRAIENECYVAIAGSVGNLPKVHNMDIQFAQSGVFTPCDFSFPLDGIKAEATPNTEMILIADVDLDLLAQLHTYGAVRNMKDRRKDLYQLTLQDKQGTPATQYPRIKVVTD